MVRQPFPEVSGIRLFHLLAAAGFAVGVLLMPGSSLAADSRRESMVSSITVSRPFFNPSLGQRIEISLSVSEPGSLTVQILDRDGYPVRKLVSEKPVEKGSQSLAWDGRDDAGEIVADEAYSVKIDLSSRGKTSTYFPASRPVEPFSVTTGYYDRRGGILSYRLPRASRVHVQAGSARIDPKTKKPIGPVLKTLVNREPRVAGSVVENWNGLDESGAIRVADLPNFRVAIAAEPLPENSIITVGNHSVSFLERAGRRAGASLLSFHGRGHHHRGLTALEDVSPKLQIALRNGVWWSTERFWTAHDLTFTVSLSGPSAEAFAREPARLHVFIDQEPVKQVRGPTNGLEVTIPDSRFAGRIHDLEVNWESDYGPVAVNSLRMLIGELPTGVPGAGAGHE